MRTLQETCTALGIVACPLVSLTATREAACWVASLLLAPTTQVASAQLVRQTLDLLHSGLQGIELRPRAVDDVPPYCTATTATLDNWNGNPSLVGGVPCS